ncbi:MAG: hypothetical protein ACLR4A_14260 [Christensenellales bacterium]
MEENGQDRFSTQLMQPLVMLILLQAAILLGSLYLSGIFSQVNSNERSILGQAGRQSGKLSGNSNDPAMVGYR